MRPRQLERATFAQCLPIRTPRATAEYRSDRNDHAPVAQWVEQRIYIPSAPDKRLVPVRARPGAPLLRPRQQHSSTFHVTWRGRKKGCICSPSVYCDRGTENQANWHKAFARSRFHLNFTPTAASRFNSSAENILNYVNNDVCHWMDGNTLPDRYGRAVDGRFKSVRTACLAFPVISSSIEHYLFESFPNTPNANGVTFQSDYSERREHLGSGGKPCTLDDDFLIATSVPRPKFQSSEQFGIRLTEGKYLNHEMQDALRHRMPNEVRSDCTSPSLVWVRVGSQWFKALRSDAADSFDMTDSQKIAKHWAGPMIASLRRAHREEASKIRLLRARREIESIVNARPSIMHAEEQVTSGTQAVEEAYPETNITSLDEYEDL